MYSRLLVALTLLAVSVPCAAQVIPAAERPNLNLALGGGMDFWWGDWSGAVKRFGPYGFTTLELTHGLGINVDGHSMILGTGGSANDHYKYFVGEGGVIYTIHRWRRVAPLMKAQIGYASLSFPDLGLPYQHTNGRTTSFGLGADLRNSRHVWTRVEYQYSFFPHFYSVNTHTYKDLNPAGISAGVSYHFR